jgi:hypothetical protein
MQKTITVSVQKETHDIGVLVSGVVKGLIAKKPIAEIAVGELQALKEAVDNITAVPAELSEDPGAFALSIAVPLADILSAVNAAKKAPASEAPAPSA